MMTKPSQNEESIGALRERVISRLQQEPKMLDDEIEVISQKNAANGSLRSGKTISETKGAAERLIRSRAEMIFEVSKRLPLTYTSDLEEKIGNLLDDHFTHGLAGLQVPILNLVRKVGVGNFEDKILGELRAAQMRIVSDLKADFHEYVLRLKYVSARGCLNSALLIIEGACLGGAGVLAILWAIQNDSEYEPYVVLLMLVIPALEVFRRLKGRAAK